MTAADKLAEALYAATNNREWHSLPLDVQALVYAALAAYEREKAGQAEPKRIGHAAFWDNEPMGDQIKPLRAAPPAIPEGYALNIDEMVNRFLCWKLPQDFYPDNFISFDAKAHDRWGGYPQSWPVGTNLLNVQQARQMIEYILAVKVQQP